MISVLLNWLYILITAGSLGCGILYLVYQKTGFCCKSRSAYFFTGILAVTVYAQLFSLFGKVSLVANFVLLFSCLLIWKMAGKNISHMLQQNQKRESWQTIVCLLALVLFFAYGTAEGYMMYDSDLYHGQSIRWAEEFGAVKGLGNLQSRLAYNSAVFPLTAFYSMKFLLGQSLHCVAGLMALVVFLEGLQFLKCFQRKKIVVSDFARVGALYYVALIYKEMMSPASDYFTILTIFYIVIKWLVLLEKKEKEVTPYALLCVLCVLAVTFKISAAMLLLLVIKPAVSLLLEKRWKEIVVYLLLGLLTAFPYFARNVLISGWLVYPYTVIDLFAFDWKIPVFMANYDAQEIQVWARGIYDVAQYHMPTVEWMKNWFLTELTGMEKLLVLSSLVATLSQIVLFAYWLIRKKADKMDWIHLLLVLTACFFFWLFSAPMIRYGYAYPLLLPFVTLGVLMEEGARKSGLFRLAGYVFLCLVSGYRCTRMGQEAIAVFKSFGVHAMQQDYGSYEAEAERIGDITVYVPTKGDRIGYDPFPSTRKTEDVLPRGETLKEGFAYYYR